MEESYSRKVRGSLGPTDHSEYFDYQFGNQYYSGNGQYADYQYQYVPMSPPPFSSSTGEMLSNTENGYDSDIQQVPHVYDYDYWPTLEESTASIYTNDHAYGFQSLNNQATRSDYDEIDVCGIHSNQWVQIPEEDPRQATVAQLRNTVNDLEEKLALIKKQRNIDFKDDNNMSYSSASTATPSLVSGTLVGESDEDEHKCDSKNSASKTCTQGTTPDELHNQSPMTENVDGTPAEAQVNVSNDNESLENKLEAILSAPSSSSPSPTRLAFVFAMRIIGKIILWELIGC